MRILRPLSALSATLLSLTLAGSAVAAEPGQTLRSGRFPVAGLAVGQRASNVVLEKAAPAVAFEQVRWASPVSFGAARTVELANGERVVKLPQIHLGLPVAMRGVAVTFGNDAANLVAAKLEEDLPSSVTPAINATTAAAAASKAAGLPMDPSRAVLAIWPTGDGAKLVWALDTAAIGLPYQPVVAVDALNGEVLIKYNAATSFHQANVYPSNPVKSPALTSVTLNVGAGKTTLENDLVQSLNCIDNNTVKPINIGISLDIHICDLLQTSTPDAMSNYLVAPGGDKDPEDAFSEVSMFYHVNRAYDFFRIFNEKLDVNAGTPIPTVSNFRVPQGFIPFDYDTLKNTSLPLAPFQNAFFAPKDPLFSTLYKNVTEGGMWFGQGPNKDYSYDGDVIYHEFTHSVVNVTLKLAGTPHMDEYGTSYSPGAMNEGLADYFSSALTGDPDVGEYATQDFAAGAPFIRSLANPDTCPTAVGGEVHQDATMFSASLWDARKTLTVTPVNQQLEFDRSVFTAMNKSATGDLGFEEFAKLVLDAITASSLGAPVAQKLSAAFTARGLLPHCSRVLEYEGKTLSGPQDIQGIWFAPGTQTTGVKNTKGWTPGIIQFHDALPAGTTTLTVDFTSLDLGGAGPQSTPFAPQLMVRFAKDPIQFKYKPLKAQAENVLVPATKKGSTYTTDIPVPAGSTEAYVMVVSSGQSDGAYTALSLSTDSVVEPTTSATTGAGVGGGSSTATSTSATTTTTAGAGGSGGGSGGEDEVVGGCGCSVPGAGEPSTGAAIAAMAALGLIASRRRRR